MPSRAELQTLTHQRIDEAKALLPLSFTDVAFYLAGYSIELALKAVVCRTLDQDDFYQPDRSNKAARYVQDRIFREFKTHNYSDLLVLSGLSAKFEAARLHDAAIDSAWIGIEDEKWSEQVRYYIGAKSVQDVYEFITNVEIIVAWIRTYW